MTWASSFAIAQRQVGQGCPTYVIAEIGSNHDQDLGKAKALIDAAAAAGVDAVKFQSLRFDRVHHAPAYGKEAEREFARIALEERWHLDLAEHSRAQGVHFLSSVTYLEAVDLLVEAGAPAIKIASAQFDILPEVVARAAATGLPLVMSAGLTDLGGIERMLRVVAAAGGRQIVLMHCITQYPAEVGRVNLRIMNTYRQAFGCPVGYSDHTLGIAVAPAAVALGAVAIEKHFTLDRAGTGPDHHFAVTPDELRLMVQQIRTVEAALGDGVARPLNDEETAQREAFLYKWVTVRALPRGARLQRDQLVLRRAPGGIPQDAIAHVERHRLRQDLDADTLIEWSQLEYVD